jgi:hypothetical protein
LRTLRDQLEGVHAFLAAKAPSLAHRRGAFEEASDAIAAAQQLVAGGAPPALAASLELGFGEQHVAHHARVVLDELKLRQKLLRVLLLRAAGKTAQSGWR